MFLKKKNYPKKPTKKKKKERKKLTCPFVFSLFCSFLPTTDPFLRCTRRLTFWWGWLSLWSWGFDVLPELVSGVSHTPFVVH